MTSHRCADEDPFRVPEVAGDPTPAERRAAVVARAVRGDRLANVADDLGLSYERVRQFARAVRPQRDATRWLGRKREKRLLQIWTA
jgi:hypothetical protein